MKKEKIWIVPNNDLEAQGIIELLERNGETYIVTGQGWGASWEMLELEVFKKLKEQGFEIEDEYIGYLREFDQKVVQIDNEISNLYGELYNIKEQNGGNEEVPEIIEIKQKINELKVNKNIILNKRQDMASQFLFSINRQAYEKGITIYGVELKGLSRGAENIDHHSYDVTYDTGVPKIDKETGKQQTDYDNNSIFIDDRSNQKASIEQVAEVLGIELLIDEMFIAANDKGFIPEMKKLGKALDISEENLDEIIANIRMRDRQMQGITIIQEVQAQEAIEKLGEIKEKIFYILVNLPHSKSATVTDRLFGKYDNLLVISGDGETNFFGMTDIVMQLNEKFPGGWIGGQLDQGSGFWGGYADQKAIKNAVEKMIQKIRDNKEEADKEIKQ